MQSPSFADLVGVSAAVAATSKRTEKTRLLAELLSSTRRAALTVTVSYLMGVVPQGKLGVGYSALSKLDVLAADSPTLELEQIDAAFGRLATTSGPGSGNRRLEILSNIFAATDQGGQEFLGALIVGELRQGAQAGLMADAIAAAFELEPPTVRRAAMLAGDLVAMAVAAADGGAEEVTGFGLTLFQPVQPMLAQSAESVAAALGRTGKAAIEWKFDSVRVQMHRRGDRVELYSRNLRRITGQLSEIAATVGALPFDTAILDAEVIALRGDSRPLPFQQTMGHFGRQSLGDKRLALFIFDGLHLDGDDLIELPDGERRRRMEEAIPSEWLVPRIETDDPAIGQGFMDRALDRGHEGVMIKSLESTYEAGRRGAGWIKVKPVHTLDLVVLAVEWGSGRRSGWLSNIHLGALDAMTGEFVMLGKTFKGMTDEMLTWQTERFVALETHREGHVVNVRPEQVVEIAIDGVQASTRYPGGIALRFPRVKGYRTDKGADEADTIDTVRRLFNHR